MKKLFKRREKEDKKTEKEKMEERREKVLAQGRKFKYPLQYAKHTIIAGAMVVAILAIAISVVLGWTLLYKVQNTSDVLYRISKVIPLTVAEVDGEKVRFSDYLMLYRSSLATVEQQSGQFSGEEEVASVKERYKRIALDRAEEQALALKYGRELGIEINDEQIDELWDEHRKMGGVDRSEESFLKILNDNFKLSRSEYRRMLYLSLMKLEVEKQIDKEASGLAAEISGLVGSKDFATLAKIYGERVQFEETGGLIDNKNVDGGRSNKAMSLEPGQVSEQFVSNNGEGYFFVKLIEKNKTQVNYMSLAVPFGEFTKRMEEVREKGLVKEYIKLSESDAVI